MGGTISLSGNELTSSWRQNWAQWETEFHFFSREEWWEEEEEEEEEEEGVDNKIPEEAMQD